MNIKFEVTPYKSKVKLSHRWYKKSWIKFTNKLEQLGYEVRENGLCYVRNKKIIDDYYMCTIPCKDIFERFGESNEIKYIVYPNITFNVGAIRCYSGYQYLQDISLDIIQLYIKAVQRYLSMIGVSSV